MRTTTHNLWKDPIWKKWNVCRLPPVDLKPADSSSELSFSCLDSLMLDFSQTFSRGQQEILLYRVYYVYLLVDSGFWTSKFQCKNYKWKKIKTITLLKLTTLYPLTKRFRTCIAWSVVRSKISNEEGLFSPTAKSKYLENTRIPK